ncbi:MAG: PKD domain-containing protein, partial [Candidatus Sigynarchaeota archaeon]
AIAWDGSADIYFSSTFIVPTPIADFTATPTNVHPGSAVQFTFTGNLGAIPSTLTWDFGDGSPASSELNPTHVYTTAGIYTVSLTVTDANLATDTETKVDHVRVSNNQAPTVNFVASMTTASIGQAIDFTDLSIDDDGTIVGWNWNFGDGSPNSTLKNPTHVYDAAGNYTITLAVEDDDGAMATLQRNDYMTIIANLAPVANFTATPTISLEGNSVQFTDTSTDLDGIITAREWDFGDGTANSTLMNPAHVYTAPGVYTVTLVVMDNLGAVSIERKRDFISIIDIPPVPDFNVTTTTIDEWDSVQFVYAGSGDVPVSYQWNFGDGKPNATEPHPYHQFTSNGTYTITLTVIDDDGTIMTCKKEGYMTVSNVLHSVSLTANATLIVIGQSITFDCTCIGGNAPFNYTWICGNAPFNISWPGASQPNTTFITLKFLIPGNYTIICIVVDADGDMAIASVQVRVLPEDVPQGTPWDINLTIMAVIGSGLVIVGSAFSIKAIKVKIKKQRRKTGF